jgi:hypothetical protein
MTVHSGTDPLIGTWHPEQILACAPTSAYRFIVTRDSIVAEEWTFAPGSTVE